jgi:hypothetical protein
MFCAVAVSQTTGPRTRRGPVAWLCAVLLMLAFSELAQAQLQPSPVDVVGVSATRGAEIIALDYQLRVELPPAVEDAARRGVPLYFVASATLFKPRWYWRDKRIARERREWRLTFQPLTSTWRVSQGGLGQSHDTLADAMAMFTRSSGWRLADAAQAEADGKHYVEFEWTLDTTQLPRPLQIGVTGVGGSSEWALGVERTLKLEAAPAASAPSVNASPRTTEPK